jgi:hypothetical protein
MAYNQQLSVFGQISPNTTGIAGQVLTSNGSSSPSYWANVSSIGPAFDRANTAQTISIAAFAQANTGGGATVGAAFDRANSAQTIAIAAFTTANAAVNVATLNGANTAVGAGANAYAASIGTTSNTIAIAAFTTANAAVNVATLNGANTAVGAGANAYAALVGSAANAIAVAAFAAANSSGGAGVAAAFDRANSAQTIAIAAFAQANTGGGGGSSLNTANIVIFSNTRTSTNANSGGVIVAGGLGVGGNVYTDESFGFALANNLSVVYTFYNNTTSSLDTVFG